MIFTVCLFDLDILFTVCIFFQHVFPNKGSADFYRFKWSNLLVYCIVLEDLASMAVPLIDIKLFRGEALDGAKINAKVRNCWGETGQIYVRSTSVKTVAL